MKALQNKIFKLIDQIEAGIYTRHEAFRKVRGLKGDLDEKYERDDDRYQTLLYCLIDAHNAANDLK